MSKFKACPKCGAKESFFSDPLRVNLMINRTWSCQQCNTQLMYSQQWRLVIVLGIIAAVAGLVYYGKTIHYNSHIFTTPLSAVLYFVITGLVPIKARNRR